jgi:hypothetical protein
MNFNLAKFEVIYPLDVNYQRLNNKGDGERAELKRSEFASQVLTSPSSHFRSLFPFLSPAPLILSFYPLPNTKYHLIFSLSS